LHTKLGWKKLCLSSGDGYSSVCAVIYLLHQEWFHLQLHKKRTTSLGEKEEEDDLTDGTVSNVLDSEDDQDQDATQPLQILSSCTSMK
jgi:hypothetical protein